MTDDPIVGEIRDVRRELSEECGHDIHRLGEMIRAWQKESGREYVQPPKKAKPPSGEVAASGG